MFEDRTWVEGDFGRWVLRGFGGEWLFILEFGD